MESGFDQRDPRPSSFQISSQRTKFVEITKKTLLENAPSNKSAEVSESNIDRSIKSDISETTTDKQSGDYPVDGLFAIWQAFLAMLLIFSTWGANAAFGVFLNYYMTNDTFPGASKLNFALIAGMIVFLAQLLAPVTGLLVGLVGQTPILVVGLFLQTAGYLLASFSTQLWQVYCCQGLLVGLSFSLMFIPGTMIIPTWFSKRMSLGMGISVSGTGFGGLLFTLALNKLIAQTDSQRWPLRMVCFVTLFASGVSICFMRPRDKKVVDINLSKITWKRIRNEWSVVFDLSLFKYWPYSVICVWYGLCLMGGLICLFTFPSYATSMGLTQDQANNLLAIFNASQLVGRPVVGNIADNYGRSTTSGISCLCVGIMILAFWRNATTYTALIILSIFLAFPAGVGSTMAQSLAADILNLEGIPELMPAAWSGLNIVVSFFCLPSEVIAIALKTNSAYMYNDTQIFTGCVFLLAFCLQLLNREYLVRKKLAQRFVATQEDEEILSETGVGSKVSKSEREEWLLQPGVIYYFVRMFYPMRV